MDRNQILEARIRTCAQCLPEILSSVLADLRPADRIISSFLRQNRKFGSADRRLLSESFFSILRWWGFIRKLFPDTAAALSLQSGEEKKDQRPQTFNIYRMMLFSAAMDGISDPENQNLLCEKASFQAEKLARIGGMEDFTAKAGRIIEGFRKLEIRPEFDSKDLIPEWIREEISPGDDLEKLIRWFQKRPPMWLRAQTEDIPGLVKELSTSGLKAIPSRKVPAALQIPSAKINLYTLESFRKGLFEVQDIASQAIGILCNPLPGQRWWDACAGAGGKSLQLASMMKGRGTVLSTDIREYKLEDLRKRARRAGFSNIRCAPWNGKGLRTSSQESFDGVLVDAPCSCSGTWRRNPDARWTSSREEIAELAELQKKLLANASKGVKKGGALVYATCSIFTRENELVVEEFLRENNNFRLESARNPITGETCDGKISVRPWDSDCDAIFAARMIRI